MIVTEGNWIDGIQNMKKITNLTFKNNKELDDILHCKRDEKVKVSIESDFSSISFGLLNLTGLNLHKNVEIVNLKPRFSYVYEHDSYQELTSGKSDKLKKEFIKIIRDVLKVCEIEPKFSHKKYSLRWNKSRQVDMPISNIRDSNQKPGKQYLGVNSDTKNSLNSFPGREQTKHQSNTK